MTKLYDVIEIGMEKPHPVRLIDQSKNLKQADAIIAMAVARRGVGDHFFKAVPLDAYRNGDPYRFEA